jgi:hypothetical protein
VKKPVCPEFWGGLAVGGIAGLIVVALVGHNFLAAVCGAGWLIEAVRRRFES